MAHFARIENGIVVEVIVVANDVLLDDLNNESEILGKEFLADTYGPDATYIQYSYNAATNGFRGKQAALGDIWDGQNFSTPELEEVTTP